MRSQEMRVEYLAAFLPTVAPQRPGTGATQGEGLVAILQNSINQLYTARGSDADTRLDCRDSLVGLLLTICGNPGDRLV